MARRRPPDQQSDNEQQDSNVPAITSNSVEVVQDLIFEPSPEQRMLKARFWTRYADTPLADCNKINQTFVANLTGNSTVARWWNMPGFADWFLNKDEWREKIEYLARLSLDAAEAILMDDNPKTASARVNLIKSINELANKLPARVKERVVLDKVVADATEEQLDDIIAQGAKIIKVAE